MEHLPEGISQKKQVAGWSVVAAFFITGFKLLIGIMTGSLGILSEALHSALDLLAAIITWFAVRFSDLPADKTHSYGHGKIENLSALFETVLLLITCGWIFYEATHRILTGKTHIEVNAWSYIVVISSIIIDFSRSRALSRVAKKYNSQALEADALHFSTDIWSSSVVLLGLVFANFGFFLADSVAAILVGIIVVFVSMRLAIRSIDGLLDRVPEKVYNQITVVLGSYPEIVHYHDLRVRNSGADHFVDVTVHLEPSLSLNNAHEISERIEHAICAQVPRCHVLVHFEPDDSTH